MNVSSPGLPRRARPYLFGIAVGGVVTALAAIALASGGDGDLVIFLVLAACAAVAQMLVFEVRSNHGFATATLFVVAAALLLPPALVVLIGVAQHLPHLLRRRFPWYIQTFNVSSDALNALAAALAVQAVAALGLEGQALFAVGGPAACLVLVGLNHTLLAGMLGLARGRTFRESGLFSAESLSIDLVLALLGVALASLADANLALVPAVVAPLLLIHRLLVLMASAQRPRATTSYV